MNVLIRASKKDDQEILYFLKRNSWYSFVQMELDLRNLFSFIDTILFLKSVYGYEGVIIAND